MTLVRGDHLLTFSLGSPPVMTQELGDATARCDSTSSFSMGVDDTVLDSFLDTMTPQFSPGLLPDLGQWPGIENLFSFSEPLLDSGVLMDHDSGSSSPDDNLMQRSTRGSLVDCFYCGQLFDTYDAFKQHDEMVHVSRNPMQNVEAPSSMYSEEAPWAVETPPAASPLPMETGAESPLSPFSEKSLLAYLEEALPPDISPPLVNLQSPETSLPHSNQSCEPVVDLEASHYTPADQPPIAQPEMGDLMGVTQLPETLLPAVHSPAANPELLNPVNSQKPEMFFTVLVNPKTSHHIVCQFKPISNQPSSEIPPAVNQRADGLISVVNQPVEMSPAVSQCPGGLIAVVNQPASPAVSQCPGGLISVVNQPAEMSPAVNQCPGGLITVMNQPSEIPPPAVHQRADALTVPPPPALPISVGMIVPVVNQVPDTFVVLVDPKPPTDPRDSAKGPAVSLPKTQESSEKPPDKKPAKKVLNIYQCVICKNKLYRTLRAIKKHLSNAHPDPVGMGRRILPKPVIEREDCPWAPTVSVPNRPMVVVEHQLDSGRVIPRSGDRGLLSSLFPAAPPSPAAFPDLERTLRLEASLALRPLLPKSNDADPTPYKPGIWFTYTSDPSSMSKRLEKRAMPVTYMCRICRQAYPSQGELTAHYSSTHTLAAVPSRSTEKRFNKRSLLRKENEL